MFGPVDLQRLREGVVEIETTGMLPEAAPATMLPGGLELWRWTLPRRLDENAPLPYMETAVRMHLLSTGSSIWERESPTVPLDPLVLNLGGQDSHEKVGPFALLQTSGEYLVRQTDDGAISFSHGVASEPVAVWTGIRESWAFRVQGPRLATWTASGNVAVIDMENRQKLALVSLR